MNKKQLKALANSYEEVYNLVLHNYPPWKRNAVMEDLQAKRNSGFVQEFVKSVIAQTEASELDLTDKKIVPSKKKAVKDSAEKLNKKV